MLSPPNIIGITKIANNFDHPVMPNTVPAELVKVSRAFRVRRFSKTSIGVECPPIRSHRLTAFTKSFKESCVLEVCPRCAR